MFKWWCYLHYWQNNSQIKFEHSKFNANLENLLLLNYSTEFLDTANIETNTP